MGGQHVAVQIVLTCGLLVLGVACYTLTINPETIVSPASNKSVQIRCTADVPLTGCQVTWQPTWRGAPMGPLIDLSQGNKTHTNSLLLLNQSVTGYSYLGQSLADGHCGVTLQMEGMKERIFGCRVHTAQGGWKYTWATFRASNDRPIPGGMHVTHREAVVLPGHSVTIMCNAPSAELWVCKFYLFSENRKLVSYTSNFLGDPNSRYRYYGDDQFNGYCGMTLDNVTEADNGPTLCELFPERQYDMRVIPVIVARPPSAAPVLTATFEGSVVLASCFVGDSRPVANITWLLGEEVVREDAEDDAPADATAPWRWPWDVATITQKLTRTLGPEDHGKTLTCRASHVALAQPMDSSQTIPSS